jgi:hypothetical protein
MSSINSKQKNKQGMSLLFAVLVMSILLAIGSGVSGILIPQIKMLGDIGYSVVAFYAADSGIEEILVDRSNPPSEGISGSLSNGASYQVYVKAGGEEGCAAEFNYCIKSIGSYKGIKRAIEIHY